MDDMDKTKRMEAITSFVATNGWSNADICPLPVDASTRSYTRLSLDDKTCLLMDAPPPQESLTNFIIIDEHLAKIGLRTPKIFARDLVHGFALIEDFGRHTFTQLLKAGFDEQALYFTAIDALKQLHTHPLSPQIAAPKQDMQLFLTGVGVFADYYMPFITGQTLSPKSRIDYDDLWRDALLGIESRTETLVLRDYHVDNLMLLDPTLPLVSGASPINNCGVLDFQDSVIGCKAYDLISILEDARRDIPKPIVEASLQRYFDGVSKAEQAAICNDMALMAAQRHCRIAGVFVRLTVRDGRTSYMQHMPRVVRYLSKALHNPQLSRVRDFIISHLGNDLGASRL